MKKSFLTIGLVIFVLIIGWLVLRFVIGGDEDTWLCQNGQWVKHGNPSSPKPTTGCEEKTNTSTGNINETENEVALDPSQFNWSTMNQGPYRDKVTYATSTDLINWTASGQILAEHASVPGAVIKNGVIYVYYVDVSENGVAEQLGMVSSRDNSQTWTDRQILMIDGLGNRTPADPDPVLLDDGRIRLFYFDINEARLNKSMSAMGPDNKIYSAISSDGINFTQEEGVRFQRQGIFDPDVNLFSNTWYLYGGDVEGNKVVVATSEDGLTFTEKGTAYSNGAVPDVSQEGNQYYLFTAGIDISISSDPTKFTRSTKSFHDSQYQITADPSVVKLGDGNYLMLYKVKPGR